MNILFFLTPKNEVDFIYDDFTIQETLNKMEEHKYSAIPIINKNGKYIGTLTEGDLLWSIKENKYFSLEKLDNIYISEIKRKRDNLPVNANSNIEDLVEKSLEQNFIPVIDDNNIFIGIITRKEIIDFCFQKYKIGLENKIFQS